MLESKYLTQDGIKLMLQHIYDKGFKYIYFNSDINKFQVSQQKPCFVDDVFMYCDGFKKDIADGFSSKVLNDWLDAYNYIDVLDELQVVDWSKVPVDTPVLVTDEKKTYWIRRYFAGYKDGYVYTWDDGRTSWTDYGSHETTKWKHAKLAE